MTTTLFDSIAATVEGRAAPAPAPAAVTTSTAGAAVKAAKRKRVAKAADTGPAPEAVARVRADMQAVADAGLDPGRVGSLVWWSASDIRVDAHRLWCALSAVDADGPPNSDGTPTTFASLVKEPATPAMALRRAIARRQHVLKEDAMRWHDLGEDSAGATVVGLGEEEADADGRDWRGTCRLVVSVDVAGVITRPAVMTDADHERVEAMLGRYDIERRNLTATDVGAILTTILLEHLGGFRVKAGGGLYLVPAPHDERVAGLAAAFALAGVDLMQLAAGVESRGTFAPFAKASLIDDIARLTEQAKAAEAKATEAFLEGRPRNLPGYDTQAARLAELAAIESRADMLGHLLGALDLDVKAACEAARKATKATQELIVLGRA